MPRYSELYAGLSPTSAQDIAAVYAQFVPGVQTNDWLLGAVARGTEYHVLAYLGIDHQVHVVHRLERLRASLQHPAPRLVGTAFGLIDETNDFGGNVVGVGADIFSPVEVQDVPSTVAVADALAATRAGHQLLVQPDAGASDVSTRFCILVPPPVVPELLRCLTRGPVHPRALWMIVANILAPQPALEAACEPFVDWCRVAVAMGAAIANPLCCPQYCPASVVVDEALGRSRAVLRDRDFPPPGVPGMAPAALQPIVDAMAALGAAGRDRDDAKEALRSAEAEEKVAPSRVWESGIDRLLRLCQVLTEAELPPIWARLAKKGIKHGREVLDAAAREKASDQAVALPMSGRPIISPEMARAVGSLHFFDGRDDLEGCLSIFAVSYPDQESIMMANELHGLYDQQAAGTTALSYSELLDIKKARSLRLPATWLQLRTVIGAHHRLLQILLGEHHVVPRELLHFVEVLDDLAATELEPLLPSAKLCAEIMRSLHIYTWSWSDQQERSATLVRPKFGQLADQFRLHCWIAPPLPPKLLAVLKPTSGGTGRPGAAPALQPAPSETPTSAAHRESGVFDGSISIARLLKLAAPPKLPNGRAPCLNYHVHGSCKSTCPYVHDHRKHSAEETAVLAKYMAEHRDAAKAPLEKA